MTAPTCRADSLSVGEPMGGTAPPASRLVIVEQPGPWGSAAVQGCRMNPEVKTQLEELATTTDIKVFLARRQDRKRLDGCRNVWFMQRIGRHVAARHLRIPETVRVAFPEDLLPEVSKLSEAPIATEPAASPSSETFAQTNREVPVSSTSGTTNPVTGPGRLDLALFVCTNGARDRCCAVEGRGLIKLLSPQVWEISHLGGHRFAPTALRFPDGLLFGRLDVTSARELVSGMDPLPGRTRGRFGRDPWQQIAELSVAGKTGIPVDELDSSGKPGSTTVSDSRGTTWTVRLSQRNLPPRRVSCGKDPVTNRVYVPGLMSST